MLIFGASQLCIHYSEKLLDVKSSECWIAVIRVENEARRRVDLLLLQRRDESARNRHGSRAELFTESDFATTGNSRLVCETVRS